MKELKRALEGLPETITASLAPMMANVENGAMAESKFWELRQSLLDAMGVLDPLGPTIDVGWLEDIPFNIAFPMMYALDEAQSWHSRLANLIFSAYQATRLTGLVLLVDYLEAKELEPKLDARIRGLQMPHWFEWAALNNTLVKFWQGRTPIKPSRASMFPELVENWNVVATRTYWDGGELDVPGLNASKAPHPFEAMWKLRNDVAHRSGTHINDDPETIQRVEKYTPVARAMLERLFKENPLEIWGKIDGGEIAKLHGPRLTFEPSSSVHPNLEEGLSEFEVIATNASYQGTLPVFPFCVTEEQCAGGAKVTDPMIMLDQVRKQHIILQGVLAHHESSELVGPLLTALRKKKIALIEKPADCKPEVLAGYAEVTSENTFERLLHRKYFPEFYQTRRGVDDTLREWLANGQKPLLVQGVAGSGKSSLLLHHAKSWGEESDKHVLLLLSGREDLRSSNPDRCVLLDILESAMSFERGVFASVEGLISFLREKAKNHSLEFLFVFDALNEAPSAKALIQALDNNLSLFHGAVRLLLSLRPEKHLFTRDPTDDAIRLIGESGGRRHRVPFHHIESLEAVMGEPCLALEPMNAEEARSAYRARQKAAPERACSTRIEDLSSSLVETLQMPFCMHIFHELYAGKEDDGSIYSEQQLLEHYVNDLEQRFPRLKKLFMEVGADMVQNRAPSLHARQAHDLEGQNGKPIGYTQKFAASAVELLTTYSDLMRVNWRRGDFAGLLFNHQLVCEIILERFIRAQKPEEAYSLRLALWLEKTRSEDGEIFDEFVNALDRICCAHLLGGGDLDELRPIFAWEDEVVRGNLVRSLFIELVFLFPHNNDGVWSCFTTFEAYAQEAGKWLDFVQDLLEMDQDVWMMVEAPLFRDSMRTHLFAGLREQRERRGDSRALVRAIMKLGVLVCETQLYRVQVEGTPGLLRETIDAANAAISYEDKGSAGAYSATIYLNLAREMRAHFLQVQGRLADALFCCEEARQGYLDLREDEPGTSLLWLRLGMLDIKRFELMQTLGEDHELIMASRDACLDDLERAVADDPGAYLGHLLHIWALHMNARTLDLEMAEADPDELLRDLDDAIARVKTQLEQEHWHLHLKTACSKLLDTAARLAEEPDTILRYASESVSIACEIATRSDDSHYYALYAVHALDSLAARQAELEKYEEARESFWRAAERAEALHEKVPEHLPFSYAVFDLFFSFASDEEMFPEQEDRLVLIERGATAMLSHWEAFSEDLDTLRKLTVAFNCAGVTHRQLGNRDRARFWLRYDLEASERIVALDDAPVRVVDLVYAELAYQSVLDDMEQRYALLDAVTAQMHGLYDSGRDAIDDERWAALCDAFDERALGACYMSDEELGALEWRGR